MHPKTKEDLAASAVVTGGMIYFSLHIKTVLFLPQSPCHSNVIYFCLMLVGGES
jgi:hypothetical protein